jgi:cyanophycinase
MRIILYLSFLICLTGCDSTQPVSLSNRGKLFIIGGGDRTLELLQGLKRVANLKPGCTIAVLPMAGEEPDSSFVYFEKDIPKSWGVKCINLNFASPEADIEQLKLNLKEAKTVFICGGDQSRFMEYVRRHQLGSILKSIYESGATIAGTSAGAAVMSDVMITGNQQTDTAYSATYPIIQKNNGIYAKGLGFIQHGIIDQHFIVRSRYNRIISAQMDFPTLWGLGIDESTAAVFYQDSVEVVGNSYVIYFAPLEIDSTQSTNPFGLKLNYFKAGAKFKLLP